MKKDNQKEAENNNTTKLIDTLNKVIYDVNLLIGKITTLEEFRKLSESRLSEIRADMVDLKADNEEIKKTVAILSKEAKVLEHEIRILSERVNRLEAKTKLL